MSADSTEEISTVSSCAGSDVISGNSASTSSDGKADEVSSGKGCDLVFKNVNVKVDDRYILKNISGRVEPGKFMAVMGPSGAGKTTLLNCLAGRKAIDSGSITMNSRGLNKQLKRKISYVLQQDILLSQLTCWETLWYTAQLRLPGSMTRKAKKEKVKSIVEVLDMSKCLQMIVGDVSRRGLSGGEKKRTAIACELLTDPLLMMLDEPTSGLDSFTAYSLCCILKNYAKISGKTVIISIHQPSSQIFKLFDSLLLLCDGEVAFQGRAKDCSSFFTGLDLPCPPDYNIADHLMDVVKGPAELRRKVIEKSNELVEQMVAEWDVASDPRIDCSESTVGSQHVNEAFEDFNELGDLKFDEVDVENVKNEGRGTSRWPTSFWTQYIVLVQRYFKQSKSELKDKWKFVQYVLVAIFMGLLWFRLESEEETIRDREGVLVFISVHLSFQGITQFAVVPPEERTTVNKERLGGYYRLLALHLARITVLIPLRLLLPLTFFTLVFWISGINYNFSVYVQMLLILAASLAISMSIGAFFGAVFKDTHLALLFAIAITVVLLLPIGFFVKTLPYWINWVKYLSYLYYTYNLLNYVDLSNSDIRCAAENSRYVSCEVNRTNKSLPFISRSDLLMKQTSLSEGVQPWHGILALASMILSLNMATYFVMRFIRKPKLAS